MTSVTQTFFANLIAGTPNGLKPADCGEFEEWAQIAYEQYQKNGADGVKDLLSRLRQSEPTLYEIICSEPKPSTVFQFFGIEEFLKRPRKQYIIDGVLGDNDLAMIYGQPGSGKSFVVIDLAVAATIGEEWAGEHSIKEPLRVLYATGEGGAGIAQRVTAAINKRTIAKIDAMSHVKQGMFVALDVPQLFESESPHSARTFVEEWENAERGDVDLLIIDTLANAALGADENSAKEVGVVIEAVKYLRNELNCAVLLVHHMNKMGNYRGSSVMHGAMDLMIEVGRDEDLRWITSRKSKDGEPFGPHYFDIVSESTSGSAYLKWGVLKLKQTARDQVLEFLKRYGGKRFTTRQITDGISGYTQQTVIKYANELVTDGVVKQGLRNPAKDPSSRNPMVYWFEADS